MRNAALDPKRCASAAGNSKSPNLTPNGREMGRHPSVLRIPGTTKNLEAARRSWDRSRGSELLVCLDHFLSQNHFLPTKRISGRKKNAYLP